MDHTMYWLDAEGDRTGLEILVNNIPVERLMRTHGARLPINEFLLPGSNHVALRRSLWPSNKADEDGGDASIKLIAARFRTTMKLDERIVLEQAATFDTCPPRSVLVATIFAVDRAPSPPLASPFDRIGAAEQGLILDRLGSIAALWQAGDGDGLVKWMGQYLGDYVRAYPLETRDVMESRIKRMAAAFAAEAVTFDRATVRLETIAGANLVDCLGPQGAAIHIDRRTGPDYDMWAVVGVRRGEVVLVR